MITTTGLLFALCLAAALWLGRVFPGTRRLQPALLAAMLFAWLVLALAWWAADHFTGEGIDESVLFHLWIGLEGAGLGAYLPVIAGVLAAVLLCCCARAARACCGACTRAIGQQQPPSAPGWPDRRWGP